MDEGKRSSRPILKYLLIGSLVVFLLFASFGGFVYWQTQTITNPKKCFTTAMYKVNLCPSNSNYIRFKKVPKHFFQALLLSEDASFYSHKGFDWFEIKESFRRNIVEWRFARGGSTLTQQLAKNLYLSKEKSISRKFKEFFISRQIEKLLSKTQILEKYVNVVEFGKKLYGLKPAANKYFGKSPAALNVLESVYLVSLLPSPKRLGKSFANKKLSKNNLWRMKIILERMYRTGKINDELFVYIKMLLDDTDWPFDQYSDGMFEPMSIEDQLFEEFGEIEKDDEVFLEPSGDSESFEEINELEPLPEEEDPEGDIDHEGVNSTRDSENGGADERKSEGTSNDENELKALPIDADTTELDREAQQIEAE